MSGGEVDSSNWNELVPGGFITYYADGDEEILSANTYVIELLECESFQDFMEHTGGTFRGFVHSADIQAAEDSIWGQVMTRNGLDHIHYRIRTKTGKTIVVDDYGILVENPGERPYFNVFIAEMGRSNDVDWLTGLPNMDRFLYVGSRVIDTMVARGEDPAVVIFDVMGMKSYNARHGMDTGDHMLIALSETLRTAFGSELCCRHAGDSFCALGPKVLLESKVEQVFESFKGYTQYHCPPVMAGACEAKSGDILSLVIDRAKFACDSDRSTWESHLSWFTDEMRVAEARRVHILDHLDVAIASGWIKPYYQGIVRASTGRVCATEALARWDDPVYGMLEPALFIPILSEAGLLRKLDLYIIGCVIEDLSERIRQGLPTVPVSVNISVHDLERFNIASILALTCEEAKIPHDLLIVEFKEAYLATETDNIKEQLDNLHAEGFEVWLDDFGGGMLSLNALKDFEFDLVKLDIAFVTKGFNDRGGFIVDGVIRAAKRMGTKTLAEGVETRELALRLTAMGCNMLQGHQFFVAQPQNEHAISVFGEDGPSWEPIIERDYWDTIGLVSMPDHTFGESEDEDSLDGPLPAGVVEKRGDEWHIVRSTAPFRQVLADLGTVQHDITAVSLANNAVKLSEAFIDATRRSDESGDWELMTGPIEHVSGYQFHVKPLCACPDARAYVLKSSPTTLGSALGIYGDVPMGYAVLQMIYDEQGAPVDASYVYANDLFCKWGKFSELTIVGTTLSDIAPDEADFWIEVCRRAIVDRESFQEIAWAEHAGHWVSFSVSPCEIDNHCIFAIALVDNEQREREQLIKEGTHDKLTGLLNRRGIDRKIDERLEADPDEPFTLTLLDVDDFKTVNDLYGHDVGDEALRSLASRLTDVFPHNSVVGRNGGDEALVAIFGEEAKRTADYLDALKNREITFEINNALYHLTLSAGFSWCAGKDDLHDAYSRADEALYAVKLSGKGNYREWKPGMSEIPQRSLLGFTARELAEGMPLAMLAHRPDGELLFANEGLAQLLGFTTLAEGLDTTGSKLNGFVHADDLEAIEAAARKGFATNAGEPIEMPVRVIKRDKSVIHTIYRARYSSTSKKGQIVFAYMVGTDLDR